MDVIDIIIEFLPKAIGKDNTDFKCFNARNLAVKAYLEKGDLEMAKQISKTDYSAKTIYARVEQKK